MDKLRAAWLDSALVQWIMDYLTCRQHFVWLQDWFSDQIISRTGDPQGPVLAPFFFTFYTTSVRRNMFYKVSHVALRCCGGMY